MLCLYNKVRVSEVELLFRDRCPAQTQYFIQLDQLPNGNLHDGLSHKQTAFHL